MMTTIKQSDYRNNDGLSNNNPRTERRSTLERCQFECNVKRLSW